ncbi:MAG: trypsin-like serine protease [Lentisphaerae bacterium]|jgi:serine protease Do|nr:trypsin-like serine protease [Lentisphaerota bacterium]
MRTSLSVLVSFFLLAAAFGEETPSLTASMRLTPTVLAVRSVLPWVVNIGTERMVKTNDGYDAFYNQFFGTFYRARTKMVKEYFPLGSGVIVDSRGLVLTNHHVVRRANNAEVRLWNGKSYPAVLVGYDAPSDLCLLRLSGDFSAKPLQAAKFANPDDLMLGETVLTIGNPFGLEHSVSQGVLSAMNRSLNDGDAVYDDILQTDAAINPGNSGGPLINLDGELIGINQAIRNDAQGIGFAIPMRRLACFLSHWLLPDRFGNTWLGIDLWTPVMRGEQGVIVQEVVAGSPAAAAGLRSGDEIVAVNASRVRCMIDFGRAVWHLNVGDQVTMLLADNRKVTYTLGPMPDNVLIKTRLGLQVQRLTATLNQALGLNVDARGLAVSEILPEAEFAVQNAPWRNVLKRGDIIFQAGSAETATTADLAKTLAETRAGQVLRLGIFLMQFQRPDQADFILN